MSASKSKTSPQSRIDEVTGAVIDQASLKLALRLLRATVTERWESVDQLVRDQPDLAGPLIEGTGAWHLRHIVEIFRLHARTVMEALGQPDDLAAIAPRDAPIPLHGPWSPQSARDELLADIDRLADWLLRQPATALSKPLSYGDATNLTTMLSIMLQHIVWHAAAVHYRSRWKS